MVLLFLLLILSSDQISPFEYIVRSKRSTNFVFYDYCHSEMTSDPVETATATPPWTCTHLSQDDHITFKLIQAIVPRISWLSSRLQPISLTLLDVAYRITFRSQSKSRHRRTRAHSAACIQGIPEVIQNGITSIASDVSYAVHSRLVGLKRDESS